MKPNDRETGQGLSRDWHLHLYVVGETPRYQAAFANLTRICNEYLGDRCSIELVDLLKAPERAQKDQIFAAPTVMRVCPQPVKKVIGDLSNTELVLKGLSIPH